MSHASLAGLVTVIAIGSLAVVPTSGQRQVHSDTDGASTWTLPRTPDGQPDLQGYWTTQTFTPVERPARLAEKEFFTEEEEAALQQQLTAEGVDPLRRDAINTEDPAVREQQLYQVNRDRSYVHYDNEIWLRTRVPKGLSSRRTSLITYPPDGRFPPMTPSGAARATRPPLPTRSDPRARTRTTATRAGPCPSGAWSGGTRASRCCHPPTTIFIRSSRRPTIS